MLYFAGDFKSTHLDLHIFFWKDIIDELEIDGLKKTWKNEHRAKYVE